MKQIKTVYSGYHFALTVDFTPNILNINVNKIKAKHYFLSGVLK